MSNPLLRQEYSNHLPIINRFNLEKNKIPTVDNKNNTETSRNGMTIKMFQGGPLHEPFFIAIDNRDQLIISPNKKTVVIYVIGELEVLI